MHDDIDALLRPVTSTVPGVAMWGARIGNVSMVLSFDPAAPSAGAWIASIGSPGARTRFLGRFPDRETAVAALQAIISTRV